MPRHHRSRLTHTPAQGAKLFPSLAAVAVPGQVQHIRHTAHTRITARPAAEKAVRRRLRPPPLPFIISSLSYYSTVLSLFSYPAGTDETALRGVLPSSFFVSPISPTRHRAWPVDETRRWGATEVRSCSFQCPSQCHECTGQTALAGARRGRRARPDQTRPRSLMMSLAESRAPAAWPFRGPLGPSAMGGLVRSGLVPSVAFALGLAGISQAPLSANAARPISHHANACAQHWNAAPGPIMTIPPRALGSTQIIPPCYCLLLSATCAD